MKIIILILLLLHSTMAVKNYTGYTLLRSVPFTENHVEFLKNLSQVIEIDYWRYPAAVRKPVDILVSPEEKIHLLRMFHDSNYYYTTLIEDVQSAFDKQTIKSYIRRKMESFNFKNFFQLSDIYNWMHDLAEANPKVVEIINLGKTFEERDILGLHVVFKKSKPRSTVVIEGGIHAREWISPAFVCYMINKIVYAKESDNEQLLKVALAHRWYFVPVINPDGYAYSFENDRLWRKNRRDGHGIDLNRNFDIEFGTDDVSTRPKSETYCGPEPFSELESIAIKDLVTTVKGDLEFYLAFHSYGQLIIIPYSYSQEHLENYDKLSKIAAKLEKTISRRYGTKYIHGTAFETVGYESSGVSGDWVKKELKVPNVLTFELRDNGTFGFALPPSEIIPTCRETMDGIIELLTPKKKLYQKNCTFSPSRRSHCFLLDLVLFTVLIFLITCSV